MTAIPSIACLGVIGKNNNPLHITLFPSSPLNQPLQTPLQFSLLLSSTLDIFASRSVQNTQNNSNLSGDYGLLHCISERLSAYGFETNTGVKFVCVVDMRGREIENAEGAMGSRLGSGSGGLGLREGEMKGVFRAMGTAYQRLLMNPFFEPDEYNPVDGRGGKRIVSRRFGEDMRRIGEGWSPGVGGL